MSAASRNLNVDGRTPTTVAAAPPGVMPGSASALPTAARGLPNRRSARRALTMTTYGEPTVPSL